MNYNNNKQYNPSALEELKKIGNSILILKNEIINITSYESFMFSRNKINQKFKLFEDCLNNLINSIIYLDEKNKEKDYLINKYENEIKNIIFNHKEDNNNSEKYIKNLNDIRKTINNNNYERINIPNLNELKLNYDYGKLNPNDFLDIPPIYINKNNSRNTNLNQNNSLISSNDSKINLDYSKSNTENKLNDNNNNNINNNNKNNEIITNENINKKNEINNNTFNNINNNNTNNNNNNNDNNNINNNSLNKMDRIQKIVLEIFKDEETLKKFKSKFGDDIAHKITSNSIDEKFLIEVENEVKNLQNKQ